MSTGMRSPGGGRKPNNTGEMKSSLTRAVSPPDELLGDMAVDAWKRTCKILITNGTFEMEDCYLLMEYCNTVQLLYEANQAIKGDGESDGDGMSDSTAAGGKKLGTAIKARALLIPQLIRLSVVLKLDPGSRVIRAGGKGGEKKNDFEEF